ncbi:membrane protein [Clostridia bacterium]|nr:membrane protein [Clostridia bacterium]
MEEVVQRQQEKRGFTGYHLKMIGIVFMVFDHLHQMFARQGVPLWFSWIGRLTAPIFIFLCAEGFTYTRNRKKYLLRLYISFVVMNMLSYIISVVFPSEIGLINNIFATLFFSALLMWCVDSVIIGLKEKKIKSIILGLVPLLLLIIYNVVFILFLVDTFIRRLPPWVLVVHQAFIPNILLAEGSLIFVFLGLLFYLFRKRRILQVFTLVLLSLWLLYRGLTAGVGDTQALMGLSAILLWFYNGKKGKDQKYFFYLFYPAHIYLFYVIAWLMNR